MKNLNIKKTISLTITKKTLEKKLYLVLENNIQREVKAVESLNKKFNITKKSLKFSEFSDIVDVKEIKLPLFYKHFLDYNQLNFYLNSIKKKKSILPVFIKIKSLVFRDTHSLNCYSIDSYKIIKKINVLNLNIIKLVLVLKHLKKVCAK